MSNCEAFAYILHRRPYREDSLLIDVLTQTQGKFRCIAYPAKTYGKIIRGNLEPFRYLQIEWSGQGELVRLKRVEEYGWHRLSAEKLAIAFYWNELILQLVYPCQTLASVFVAYKNSLHALVQVRQSDTDTLDLIVLQFELQLLAQLGHPLSFMQCSDTGQAIHAECNYYFIPEKGLMQQSKTQHANIVISGQLLIALQSSLIHPIPVILTELRHVLDRIIQYLLTGKTLHSRILLER